MQKHLPGERHVGQSAYVSPHPPKENVSKQKRQVSWLMGHRLARLPIFFRKQWHKEPSSPNTVAGPRRNRTGLPYYLSPCGERPFLLFTSFVIIIKEREIGFNFQTQTVSGNRRET